MLHIRLVNILAESLELIAEGAKEGSEEGTLVRQFLAWLRRQDRKPGAESSLVLIITKLDNSV